MHDGTVRTPEDLRFTRVLSIGIGGSALGPMFVADALGNPSSDPMKINFIDNTDPDGIDRVLRGLDRRIHETLCIVISKSGGTPDSRNGMLLVDEAFRKEELDFPKYAVAVTMPGSKLDRTAKAEGWLRRFPMFDWVGGRTSVLSAVGLVPAALQGLDVDGLLAGAAACDEATRRHDLRANPAALMALMWYHATGGKGAKDMVVLPYKDRLLLFSRYLQQLVMESLGKRLNLKGERVDQGIAVYGNKGSTDQHAYVQQLRDGVNNFFVTFIRVLESGGSAQEVEPGVTAGDYLHGFLLGTRAGAVRERPRVDDPYGPARRRPDRGRADRAVRARGGTVRQPGRHQRLSPARRRGRQEGGRLGPDLATECAFSPFRNAADRRADRGSGRCPRLGRDGLFAPGTPGGERSGPLRRNRLSRSDDVLQDFNPARGDRMNMLESLKRWTTVVADTGDIEAIAEHRPQDATTNPSLLLQAAQKPQYQDLVDEALHFALDSPGDDAARAQAFMDKLFVTFGCHILKVVPGRVSTEVDAGLSFDSEATLAKARRLIDLYRQAGIGRRARAHQDRQHLGGHPRRRTTGARRDPLQPDAVVRLRPGRRLRRGRCDV